MELSPDKKIYSYDLSTGQLFSLFMKVTCFSLLKKEKMRQAHH